MIRRTFIVLAAAAAFASAARADVPKPAFAGKHLPAPSYGDAQDVHLLADLLSDTDPYTRERAVQDLADTHNPLALEAVSKAAADEAPVVRAAAVQAAANFPARQAAVHVAATALADPHSMVLLGALRAVRLAGWKQLAPAVAKLAVHGDAQVRSAALQTLTHLGVAADGGELAELLADGRPAVRLRAAENCLLLANGTAVTEALRRLRTDSQPAVRGAAVAALGQFGKLDDEALGRAAKDRDPLVRRGAVRAYALTGKAAPAEFFDDPSGLVLLAAVRAAGQTKDATAIGKLVETMNAAADEQTHLAARDSLVSIGTEAMLSAVGRSVDSLCGGLLTADAAAGKMSKGKFDPAEMAALNRRVKKLSRNIEVCCRILGRFGSAEGLDGRLEFVGQAGTSASALGVVALSLAEIEDEALRAQIRPVVRQAFERCVKLAPRYLQAVMSMSPNVPPFSEKVSGQLAMALGALGDSGAAEPAIRLARMEVGGYRLPIAAAHVCRALPMLATEANRPKAEAYLLDLLADDSQDLIVVYEAARAAGEMKLPAAADALRGRLEAPKRPPLVIQAAGWALQQITGETPKLPEPSRRPGQWIVVRKEK